jgi:EAL domain-containing protein (putative c-di-GMP-specific phosphodiesterase class I)
VVVDRFGSGQGSINALRRFRLAGVKLDPALAEGGDTETETLLPALLGVASALHLPVAAAGIGSEEQRTRLLTAGALEGQGPLFSRPLELAAAEEVLARAGGVLPLLGSAAPA